MWLGSAGHRPDHITVASSLAAPLGADRALSVVAPTRYATYAGTVSARSRHGRGPACGLTTRWGRGEQVGQAVVWRPPGRSPRPPPASTSPQPRRPPRGSRPARSAVRAPSSSAPPTARSTSPTRDLVGRAGQRVPALGAAMAVQQSGPAQVEQDALEEAERDVLRLGQARRLDQLAAAGAVAATAGGGDGEHRPERVVGARGDVHVTDRLVQHAPAAPDRPVGRARTRCRPRCR